MMTNGSENGRVGIREVYNLIHESHNELAAKIDQLDAKLDDHIVTAHQRDLRIQSLEDWRKVSKETCTDRVINLIKDEHEERHGRHMDADHKHIDAVLAGNPTGDRRVWVMWSVGIFIITLISSTLVHEATPLVVRNIIRALS